MNSGPTSERVYGALRERILANAFAPGARLDPAVLASELASSVTPVRDALHLLAGEQLVEVRPGDGFHLPHLTGPGLDDLYALNAEMLLLAMRRRLSPAADLASPPDVEQSDLASWTAILFGWLARHSVNAEHGHIVRAINDRLHAVRTVEPNVLPGIQDELEAITDATGSTAALRKEIAAYHRRRRRQAFEIVRAFYRYDRPSNNDDIESV